MSEAGALYQRRQIAARANGWRNYSEFQRASAMVRYEYVELFNLHIMNVAKQMGETGLETIDELDPKLVRRIQRQEVALNSHWMRLFRDGMRDGRSLRAGSPWREFLNFNTVPRNIPWFVEWSDRVKALERMWDRYKQKGMP